MNATHKLRVLLSGIFLAALLATTVISVPTASAATRRYVCAADLIVRNAPAGSQIGVLFWGNAIDVTSYSGTWANGYAYGNVNKWGPRRVSLLGC